MTSMHTRLTDKQIRELHPTRVRAFAPPTIANVGPGYDMFGVALNTNESVGDLVFAEKTDAYSGARLESIVNDPGLDKPNVAEVVANEILRASGENIGVAMQLTKGMAKGTGMGSSAASSVAAAVAVNALLKNPFTKNHPVMIQAVIHGEAVAIKKSRGHADNVLPCLLGGFVFIYDQENFAYRKWDVPGNIGFVLASPKYELSTADMRDALKSAPYDISQLVHCASRAVENYLGSHNADTAVDLALAGTTIEKDGGSREVVREYIRGSIEVFRGLTTGNLARLDAAVIADHIITAVRLPFIPGGVEVCKAAIGNGAYGSCISGSGPTLFSVINWIGVSEGHSYNNLEVGKAMQDRFAQAGLESSVLYAQVCNEGARIVFAE